MNKQELIDKAVDELKGVWPEDEGYDSFRYSPENSAPMIYKQEFQQRARELGWINGYKWGVEYPTNGKKPYFMDALKLLLDYCTENGIFTWKADGNNQVKAGSNAGTPDRKGYIQITLNGKRLKAHRLAYAIINNLSFDDIPEQIDHIDGVKYNNVPSNLRASTGSQNQHNRPAYSNNTSGFKGVTWNKRRNKWQAQIQVDGKRIAIGCFECIFKAARAYDDKAKELHKEFALTNESMGLLCKKLPENK